jgi:biotin carboxyl carrier protein
MGERMSHHERAVTRWYPELVRLSTHSVEEVRNTDAWVLGQDTSGPGFHEALTKMLADPSPVVRGNAALSLVRFGDATGRPQIVALLQSVKITAPSVGRIVDADKPGTAIHQNGLIAKLQLDQSSANPQTIELRSPISGRIRNLFVQTGQAVTSGTEIAAVDPGTDQVWEALRALYIVGQFDDLPAITAYTRDLPEVPDRIREQAVLTEKAIRERANAQGH